MPADHSLQYFRMSAASNHFRFLFLLLAMLMLSSCAYTRLNQVMREVGREYEGFACAALVEKTNQPVCAELIINPSSAYASGAVSGQSWRG